MESICGTQEIKQFHGQRTIQWLETIALTSKLQKMSPFQQLAHLAQYSHFAKHSKINQMLINMTFKNNLLRDFFDYENITWPQGDKLFHLHLENVKYIYVNHKNKINDLNTSHRCLVIMRLNLFAGETI
jgi:hypothetical protein